MDCKVIYGFDLSLSKSFHSLLFLLSESTEKFEQRLALVWSFSKMGFGKDNIQGGGGKLYLWSTNTHMKGLGLYEIRDTFEQIKFMRNIKLMNGLSL